MSTHGIIIIEGREGVTEYHGSTLLDVLVETNEPSAEAWLNGEHQGTLIEAVERDGDDAYKCDGCGRYFAVGDTYINNSGDEYCYDSCSAKHDYNK